MSDSPDFELTGDSNDFSVRKDAKRWREVFAESETGLRVFLRGRLNQESDVDDCLQVVFVKLLENGHKVSANAHRAWLFRVAANESARLWRNRASTQKMVQKIGVEEFASNDPADQIIQSEVSEKLRNAIKRLPKSWQSVVRLRIDENLTFQQVAKRLDIPLGTALTQMRRALERLKTDLETKDQ